DSDVRSLSLLGELILAAIRPEEEDRLAELAKKIVPQPAPQDPQKSEKSEAAPSPPVTPATVIVDEKFAPAPIKKPVAKDGMAAELASTTSTVSEPLLNSKSVPVEAPGSQPKEERALSSIALTAGLVLIVIALGWAVVWKARHSEQAISANTRLTSGPRKSDLATLAPDQQQPTPEVKAGAIPEVTGIRHWS